MNKMINLDLHDELAQRGYLWCSVSCICRLCRYADENADYYASLSPFSEEVRSVPEFRRLGLERVRNR